jgi:hypothetical protein
MPVIVNATSIPADSKLRIIKTDSAGNVMWEKTYQIHPKTGTTPYYISNTSEGGYATFCKIDSIGHFSNWFLMLDSLGDTLWTLHYKDKGKVAIIRTPEEGFIVSCLLQPFIHIHTLHFKNFDSRVFKIEPSGDTTWTGSFVGAEIYSGNEFVRVLDGGYIKREIILKGDEWRVVLTKYDSLGVVLWEKTYDKEYETYASWLEPTSDSGCIVGGYRGKKLMLMKLDPNGKVQWRRLLKENESHSLTVAGFVRCVREKKDGGYIFTALLKPKDYLISVDSKGRVLWKKSYEGFPLRNLWLAPGQGCYVLGLSSEGTFLLKIDDEGEIEWKKEIDNQDIKGYSVHTVETLDGGRVIVNTLPKTHAN